MKIYLDDERPTPEGWHSCSWPEEVIHLLKAGGVTHLSLDHDLGDDAHGTGYDVVLWIEERVATTSTDRPNSSCIRRMFRHEQRWKLAFAVFKHGSNGDPTSRLPELATALAAFASRPLTQLIENDAG